MELVVAEGTSLLLLVCEDVVVVGFSETRGEVEDVDLLLEVDEEDDEEDDLLRDGMMMMRCCFLLLFVFGGAKALKSAFVCVWLSLCFC